MMGAFAVAAVLAAPALESELDTYMKRLEAIGFSGALMVTKDDQVVIEKAYGWADRAAGRRMTTDTVFDLGSITKQFTGAAILKLESEGKLGTEDLIGKYFENVPPDKQAITLHHLLTHSSGLRSDFAESDYEEVGREEYVKRALSSELLWAPGTRYYYSNAGFSILAAVVEKVSGQGYEAFLRERLFKPAGMEETGYKLPAWPRERIAHGYRDGEDWGTILERLAPDGAPFWMLRGNGGVHTTLADVRAWDKALESDTLLPKESRVKLFTPYIDEDESGESQYAYGWVVEKTPRGTRDIWHDGGNGVYMADLHRFVDEGVLVFLASTVSELPASPVRRTVTKIVFGEPYELPPVAMAVSDAQLQALDGAIYRLPGGGEIELDARGGALVASLRGQDAYDAWSRSPLESDRARFATARALEEAKKEAGTDRVEFLGAASRPNGIVVADVRVDSDSGPQYTRFVFRGDELLDAQPRPRTRLQRLVPLSSIEWVPYDLANGAGKPLKIAPETLEIGGSRAARVRP
jgi:CubicO group peptidase (beta-lactamase class C family)